MWYARENFAKMCCKGMIKTELEFMCWKHSGTGTMLCIVMILLHNTSVTFLTGFINKLVIIFFSFIIIITNIVSTTTIPSPSLSLTSHNHHCYLPPASLVVFLFLIYLQFELWCYIYMCVYIYSCVLVRAKERWKIVVLLFCHFLKFHQGMNKAGWCYFDVHMPLNILLFCFFFWRWGGGGGGATWPEVCGNNLTWSLN